jgi:beta-N-acetylhexosaminidase
MRNNRGGGLRVAALLGVLLSLVWPLSASAQTPEATEPVPSQQDEEAWLEDTLAGMTTADKVGQLFLVTFLGPEADIGSDIAQLVQELRVSGVVLSAENENYRNQPNGPQQVLSLTTDLQTLAFTASPPITITRSVPVTFTVPVAAEPPPTGSEVVTLTQMVSVTEVYTVAAQGIPLFIAVNQEGDGYPFTALREGFTELPSNMAVGATWQDENAESMGRLVGEELSTVGVNMVLGPSLDVLNAPRPGLGGDMGVRVFGGDPYWVGKMGQAYIRGVHLGSNGRVATVAKHLPGLGASDRSLEEEIATVDKSLQELRLIELPPFFQVTGAESVTDTAKALMTAHIRYRGFQGNIRYVTPPISLHSQGMQQIMAQTELDAWRQAGGVLVSDSLGVPAVRRYYSPELVSFPHRQIALDAFQAGNDLLMVSRFSLTDSWQDQLSNIEDTILFFRDRYETDPTFRGRVDESVRRILLLKRRICTEFDLVSCTGDNQGLAGVGGSRSRVAQIAQEAVTLLYPSADELAVRMPRPPRPDEDIVIFTDAREARDCEQCAPFYLLGPQVLEDTILQMYGPDATGQVDPERIASFTFAQLQSFLELQDPDLTPFIREADWVVFAMLDAATDAEPSSMALKQFLREWTTGLETQNVVVMAYEAPYYLDSTEVSKLTAYFGMYSKADPFIETSVRALFLEFLPTGRSPVTVEGVGYDLSQQLLPDPDQVISVLWADQPGPVEGTPEPIELDVGDLLRVRTSVIVDANGNTVADGTPVTFYYTYLDTDLGGQVEATTLDGVAEATVELELPEGELEITAFSFPAIESSELIVKLLGETVLFLTPTPTPTPTSTPTPTPTSTPTPTPTATPTATPTPTPTPIPEEPPPPQPRVEWPDFYLALAGMFGAGLIVLVVGRALGLQSRLWSRILQVALWSLVAGLAAYLYYALELPGTEFLETIQPGLRGLLIGFVAGLLPLLTLPWFVTRQRRTRST